MTLGAALSLDFRDHFRSNPLAVQQTLHLVRQLTALHRLEAFSAKCLCVCVSVRVIYVVHVLAEYLEEALDILSDDGVGRDERDVRVELRVRGVVITSADLHVRLALN